MVSPFIMLVIVSLINEVIQTGRSISLEGSSHNIISENDFHNDIVLSYSPNNIFSKNNIYGEASVCSYLLGSINFWRINYWSELNGSFKEIKGTTKIPVGFGYGYFPYIKYKTVNWSNYDWHPAQKPYDISRDEIMEMKKLLAIGIIFLFIGVAVAPSINSTVVKASDDNDLVEVTSQACGIQGFGNTTVKLTKQQYQNLEQYLVDFRARLNQTTTREEAVPIFKDAVVELNKYGLLPKGMSVEKAQQLVTIGNRMQNVPRHC